jgi:hypothetical protein
MVHSQLEQRPARVRVLKQVPALVQQLVLVPELQRERRLVLAHFLRHPQLQSQFLLQQCHLREHEFR